MLQEAPMDPDNALQEELVAEDLIEDVSIDGMCGVY
jgi:mycofactocin precursor